MFRTGDLVRVVDAPANSPLRDGDEHYITDPGGNGTVALEGLPGRYMAWRFERVDECCVCGKAAR